MAYQPIENYGIVGDMNTVALVGMNGSVDWFCYPRFDSPSIFAAILDHKKGGNFRICPKSDDVKLKQFYWPETNILITRFLSPSGVGEIVDFMAVPVPENESGQLVRLVKVLRGGMKFRMECFPSFNYARDRHETHINSEGACFYSKHLSMGLAAHVPLQKRKNGAIADFGLEEGQRALFIFKRVDPGGSCRVSFSADEAHELFKETIDYWHHWISKCTYRGRWREMVIRSALVLKLMTYEPSGAIVAAPTCSLPEGIGGQRNWDYRFTWIRDAAFTLYGLMRIGLIDSASGFMDWIQARCNELNPDGSLNIMYGINGEHVESEEILDHLDGYRGSRPVRVGNGAATQLQLDIYGELMDSVYLFNKYGTPISYDLWDSLRKLVNWVCGNWERKDDGIWEIRGGKRHNVYSKLMCWVAVDRGIRLADKRSFPADREKWLNVRDKIYEDIIKKGWSKKRQAFTQYYGSNALDASVLMMPLVFFMSPTDPRMMKTLNAIDQPPEKGGLVSNSLVYRYNVEETKDGLTGDEGTFNICTFWLIEALTRAGRHDKKRLREAVFMFEQMLSYANHLGLYAEETGPSGEALGNFPQAFTHLALISAAFNLDRALGPGG
ncbi:MAG: glycoside hydrolase family 15 protein [Thermodesulfobacteriota bacterium]